MGDRCNLLIYCHPHYIEANINGKMHLLHAGMLSIKQSRPSQELEVNTPISIIRIRHLRFTLYRASSNIFTGDMSTCCQCSVMNYVCFVFSTVPTVLKAIIVHLLMYCGTLRQVLSTLCQCCHPHQRRATNVLQPFAYCSCAKTVGTVHLHSCYTP